MKKLFSALTAIAMTAAAVGCSSGNGGKTYEGGEISKVPVSQIWDRYEELQGKDLGVIKLPDKIEKPSADKLYAIELVPRHCEPEAASEQFFKAFYGDKYKADKCITDQSDNFVYNDPDVGIGVFLRAQETENYAGPGPASFNDHTDYFEVLGKYYVGKDDNVKLDLPDGSCTIGELAQTVERFMKEGLSPLYDSPDLPMKPYQVYCMGNKNGREIKSVIVNCAYSYKGLELQPHDSGAQETTIFAGHEVNKYFSSYGLSFDLSGKDNITAFSSVNLPYDPISEEIGELMPLTNAVELLEKELAVQSRYEFETVELMYCSKKIVLSNQGMNPDYTSKAIEDIVKAQADMDNRLVPTWCFGWTGYDANGAHDCFIKVNAVTGEITVDSNITAGKPLDNSSQAGDTSSSGADTDSSEADTDSSEDDEVKKPAPNANTSITVDVISYDGEVLTYEYEGKTMSGKFGRSKIWHELFFSKLVNNKSGVKVQCTIRYDADGKPNDISINTPNGSDIDGYFGNDFPYDYQWSDAELEQIYQNLPDDFPKGYVEKRPYKYAQAATARRIEGSVYELVNSYGKIQVDLNDLMYRDKADFPDEIKGVAFTAFKFESGEVILEYIYIVDPDNPVEDVDGSLDVDFDPIRIDDLPMFAGKIQSLNGDRAVVILNDGKTTCDVPTYFNDGELKEGMNVLLTLDADPELFGSGKQYKSDYAVFTTHPEIYHIRNYLQLEHSKIAYAKSVSGGSNLSYRCVMIDNLDRIKKQ